jgi:hypothetical protein
MAEKVIQYRVEIQGVDQGIQKIVEFRKENEELRKSNTALQEELKTGNWNEVSKSIEQNNIQIQKNNGEIKKLTKEVMNNGNAQQNLKKELVQAKKSMLEMVTAGDTSSKAYIEMRDRAAELRDNLDRVNAEVKIFADDAMIINAVVDTTKGLASTMQLAQSATALMGVENENLMKVLVKLQAIQGVVNGLQGVSNMLQKESRVMILGKIAAQKLMVFWVKAVAAVQWLWNAALGVTKVLFDALGIGLIIAAIAALVAGVTLLVKQWDRVVESLKSVVRWMGLLKKETDATTEAQESQSKQSERDLFIQGKRIKAMEFQIKLMKALGGTTEDIREAERKLLEERIKAEQIQMELMKSQALRGKVTADDLLKQREAIADAQGALVLFDAESQRMTREATERERQLAAERAQRASEEAERQRQRMESERQKEEENRVRRYHDEQVAMRKLALLYEDTLENRLAVEQATWEKSLLGNEWGEAERELMYQEHLLRMKSIKDQWDSENVTIEDQTLEMERQKREELRLEYLGFLEQRRQSELTEWQKRHEQLKYWLDQGALTEAEYAEEVKRIRADQVEFEEQMQWNRAQASAGATTMLVGELQKWLGAESKAGGFLKVLGEAETAINIARGLAETLKIGFPQNIPGMLAFGAQTLGLIRSIRGAKPPQAPKLSRGGIILDGPSHTQGGITFWSDRGHRVEMEGGELLAVVNKRDTATLGSLSDLNSKHGVRFGSNSTFMARGGIFDPTADMVRDTDLIKDVVSSIAQIPVVLSINELNGKQREVQIMADRGTI